MRGNFPNSLIFVIAAGVFFVAGSYALFGINDATGEPRFLNWVPYEKPKNVFLEKRTLALETALGDAVIVFDNAAPADIVNRFLGKASGGYRTFTFDAVRDGAYIEGTMYLAPAAPENEEKLYPEGTVAIAGVAGAGGEKIVVLLEEGPLPAGYLPVGSIQDTGGVMSAISLLPAREDGLIVDEVPVISARPGMQYEETEAAEEDVAAPPVEVAE